MVAESCFKTFIIAFEPLDGRHFTQGLKERGRQNRGVVQRWRKERDAQRLIAQLKRALNKNGGEKICLETVPVLWRGENP